MDAANLNITPSTSTAYDAGANSLLNGFPAQPLQKLPEPFGTIPATVPNSNPNAPFLNRLQQQQQHKESSERADDTVTANGYGILAPPENGAGGYFFPPEQYQQMLQQYVQRLTVDQQQQQSAADVISMNERNLLGASPGPTLDPGASQGFDGGTASASSMLRESFGLPALRPPTAPITSSNPLDSLFPGQFVDVMATTTMAPTASVISAPIPASHPSDVDSDEVAVLDERDDKNRAASISSRDDENNATSQSVVEASRMPDASVGPIEEETGKITPTQENAGGVSAAVKDHTKSTSELAPNASSSETNGSNSAKDDAPEAGNVEVEKSAETEPSTAATNNGESTPPATSSLSDGATESRKSSAPSVNGESEHSRQRQELIKKQMNEIEKEISRRFQNKNIKKMNEAELVQLLSNHGFGALVNQQFDDGCVEASLPYRPSPTESTASRPTLDQLRSSFSPPDVPVPAVTTNNGNGNFGCAAVNGFYDAFGNFITPQQPYHSAMMMNPQLHSMGGRPLADSFPQVSQAQNLGTTLTGGGLGLHGPAAFLTSPVLPQQQQHQIQASSHLLSGQLMHGSVGAVDMAKAAANSAALRFDTPQSGPHPAYSASGLPPSNANNYVPQMPFYNNNFQQQQQFYRQHLPLQPQPQQQQPAVANAICSARSTENVPSPPLLCATVMSPTMSNITNEMAAMLLQQIQQENPGFIENLVDQQQQRSRSNLTTSSANNTNGSGNGRCTADEVRKALGPGVLPAPPQPQNSVSRGAQKSTAQSTKVRSALGQPQQQPQQQSANREEENGWYELGKRHSIDAASQPQNNGGDNKENGAEPIWVMRDSYLKRLEREERRNQELLGEIASTSNNNNSEGQDASATAADNVNDAGAELDETEKLLRNGTDRPLSCDDENKNIKTPTTPNSKKEVMVHEPAVLIEGVLFRARYLGSTQMTTDGRPTKTSRMAQAQEAVARVKAPSGEIQPSTEIDLFISTEKIMVLNTDLQRISETDVRQDILMDHALRSISYIADIGDLVVLMARRVPQPTDAASAAVGDDEHEHFGGIAQAPRVVCHVFESEEASFIAQSIGQAFQVAYVEFLRANGIDDPAYLREIDYQEVLNSQELMGEELAMFARKETQKDVVIPKKVGEALGVVVVESGWGSILPTVVVANMAPGGPASRSNQLNIGDQIIGINGISLVGLPLATAQQNIKNAKTSTAVRLTIVSTPPVVEVRIKRPNTKYQLGFSVQNGVICSLLRGGIAERGGIRVGHRIIEINQQSVVAVAHERIVNMLATATGEIHMKTMPTSMFRLLTGQEVPNYI